MEKSSSSPTNNMVRVFLSSTFRDFGEERDLLVRKVFPSLRAKLKERFVELVDVDLRWGITVEQAERGEVLPICLAEIDRARPYFVCMLGDRYGWIPPAEVYGPGLLEQQNWLEEHRGGKSVTELEILHGVLNDQNMAGRAFFYFRAPTYAQSKGGDYIATSIEEMSRQADLKARIRVSGFPVVEDYPDPEAFAQRLEDDLWSVLDEKFPADHVPDAFERERRKHEAYAAPRRRLYLGGDRYIATLNSFIAEGRQRILIEGQSGGGKSALLANWLESLRKAHTSDLVHVHYTGASADAANPHALVRRLCESIKRATNSTEAIPGDTQKLMEGLPLWLANASAFAQKKGISWVIVIDALNGLTDLKDLRWFPEFLPERLRVVVSCLPGEVIEALKAMGDWSTLLVEPLTQTEGHDLLRIYLARYNKKLPAELEKKIFNHELSANPLFLRTLGEELRLFGVHETLAMRLDHYLTSVTVQDLFEMVLERIEGDCGPQAVRDAMEAIWASRAGLTEQEILGIANLVPAIWAQIRHAIDEALLESGGLLTFAHDYMRIAISNRYLAGNGHLIDEGKSEEALAAQRNVHATLAQWFEANAFKGDDSRVGSARAAQEIPYQWLKAKDFLRLQASLTAREMFEAINYNSTSEEHLAYWLVLERESGADIERGLQEAWKKWELDEDAAETGNLASNLEFFLSFAGRYTEFTQKLASLALGISEKKYGPEHAITGDRLSNLAILNMQNGNSRAAEKLLRRALSIWENLSGDADQKLAAGLGDLGVLLYTTGDIAAAETLYRRALEYSTKSLGPNHPDTLRCLNNLAGLLRDKREYKISEELYFRALAIRQRILGPEHPDTASTLNGLANLNIRKRHYTNAEMYCRKSLAIREKIYGRVHPDVASSLSNLGMLMTQKGEFEDAKNFLRRALTIREITLGIKHPVTGRSLSILADTMISCGNFLEAEPLIRRAISISQETTDSTFATHKKLVNQLEMILSRLSRNPNPQSVLSRGDFVSVIEFAKAVAKSVKSNELNAFYFLCGACIAANRDKVWGKEIRKFLSADLLKKVAEAATEQSILIDTLYLPNAEKMPVSDDLKKVIGSNINGDLGPLIKALENNVFIKRP